MRINRRVLKMHAMMKRQFRAGLISADMMQEADAIFAEAKLEAMKDSITGERIKAMRAREKLSQSQFAERIEVSTTCLQKWERGATIPKGIVALALRHIEAKGLDDFLTV
ncbi:transcriptional regulator [Pantoea rodasii]|uniref:Transcriptional regulator n=1 Tax=Pantoea rodasii TaxID=1076549 RepID=A0A2M9W7H3_9GAMM|nr:helix-turn-helix domain-containing protein [Pantoea rodasii]ORM66202.1 hypothetical protein HA45_00355 [Pantoea rodasii]PJZ03487.1 transcriptional regulator [Pantoea rodasii]